MGGGVEWWVGGGVEWWTGGGVKWWVWLMLWEGCVDVGQRVMVVIGVGERAWLRFGGWCGKDWCGWVVESG